MHTNIHYFEENSIGEVEKRETVVETGFDNFVLI
jgi:hypothetical protein